jgi:DNA-binding transcriptional LysR family regulator
MSILDNIFMNSTKISLTQWEIFNSVIEFQGYSKAAKELNRSHSSLHHAVRKLQEQLGVQLIEVNGKNIVMTDIGQVMYRRSKELVKEARNLELLANTLTKGWEAEIRLGIENIYPRHLLPNILKQFHVQNQISRLQLIDVVLMGAVEMIEQSRADLVITPIIPIGFLGTPLLAINMRAFAHKNHPLNRADEPVPQRRLSEHLQIVIRDSSTAASRDSPIGWLKAEQRWTVTDFLQARQIMNSGQGFCWAPDYLFEDDENIVAIPIKGDVGRQVTLYLVEPQPELIGPGGTLLANLIRKAHAAMPEII